MCPFKGKDQRVAGWGTGRGRNGSDGERGAGHRAGEGVTAHPLCG